MYINVSCISKVYFFLVFLGNIYGPIDRPTKRQRFDMEKYGSAMSLSLLLNTRNEKNMFCLVDADHGEVKFAHLLHGLQVVVAVVNEAITIPGFYFHMYITEIQFSVGGRERGNTL